MEVIPWDTGSLYDSDLSLQKTVSKDAGKSTKIRDARNKYAIRIPAGVMGGGQQKVSHSWGQYSSPRLSHPQLELSRDGLSPAVCPQASAQPGSSWSRTRTLTASVFISYWQSCGHQ